MSRLPPSAVFARVFSHSSEKEAKTRRQPASRPCLVSAACVVTVSSIQDLPSRFRAVLLIKHQTNISVCRRSCRRCIQETGPKEGEKEAGEGAEVNNNVSLWLIW